MAPLVNVPFKPCAATALDKGVLITAGSTDLPSFPAFATTPSFPTGTAAKVP